MTTAQPFFSLTDLGLLGSSSQLLQQWLTTMQANFPGYNPSAGNLEYIQAEVFSSQAADLATLCSSGGNAIFETFGTTLLNLPFQAGSPALAVLQINAIDTAGHTLPVNTQITLDQSGVPLAFQTVADAVIPQGQSTTLVTVFAVAPGTTFNGAGAPATLVAQINWVNQVTVVSPAVGGLDAEDETHYLNRLTQQLQLLAPRPITATDYAIMALSFSPALGTDQQEVGRATAIDGYDPLAPQGPNDAWSPFATGTGTYNNEREITVAITDQDGNPLTQDTATAVQEMFEQLRELNFIVNVVAPNYSPVYVTAQVQALQGFTTATVQANVQSALLSFLSPATFGLPPGGTPFGWTNTTFIRNSRVETTIQQASGVDFVYPGTVMIGLSGPPSISGDMQLPGPFPLPTSNTSTIPLSAISVVAAP